MRTLATIKRFIKSEDATTAVEYAVLLAMILTALIIGVTSAGGGVSGWWTNIKDKVTSH
jgi:pilus assembly protein Flp/PilA